MVDENAQKIMEQVPKPLQLLDIMEKYPVKYEESMNTVLLQEVKKLETNLPWFIISAGIDVLEN